MPNTFTKLGEVVTTADNQNISFSNIPGGYTDLVILGSINTTYTGGGADGYLYFQDGAGTSSYRWVKFQQVGNTGVSVYNTPSAGTFSSYTLVGPPPNNNFSNFEIRITNYSSGYNKVVSSAYGMSSSSTTTSYNGHGGGIWANNSAITSVAFAVAVGYTAGSSVYLYGVKNT